MHALGEVLSKYQRINMLNKMTPDGTVWNEQVFSESMFKLFDLNWRIMKEKNGWT